MARQTLQNRYKGQTTSRQKAAEKSQILLPEEETVLTEWCSLHGSSGKPASAPVLRGHALAISGKFPGKNWHRRFISRHPSLAFGKATGLDPKRAKNFNKTVVLDYFEKRKKLNDMFDGVPPEQDWNMDEKGLQMGGGRKNTGRKFIFVRNRKERYRIRSDNLELVTVIECISAAGEACPPSFILSNGPMPNVCDLPIGSVGKCVVQIIFIVIDITLHSIISIQMSENGWTARELCERWFSTVFVPFALARRVCSEKPIVLTLDGHDTHETPAMKRIAYENNIVIFCFPSKTTHKLQPLDVVVFSAVQRAWISHCEEQMALGVEIDRYNVVDEYVKIRGVITPDLIWKSFEKTGIYPFNPEIFTDADYAPSMASSIIAHVPSSFPAEIPSSPPAIPSDIEESDADCDYEPSLDFMPVDGIQEGDLDSGTENDSQSHGDHDSEPENGLRDDDYELEHQKILEIAVRQYKYLKFSVMYHMRCGFAASL